jgi:ABC-2 type transport system ATP-binding protein
VKGKLTPFIELGVGFNPELTGRENVFLNGALLGFGRKEMGLMYQDIVDFAEIEKFMDQKLKNYSSGMQVRLAFSIAIRAKGDMLLIDEVLAVGDLDFQKKCYDYFFDLKNKKQTVIFVTHDMGAIRKFCDRCLLIENGKIKMIGKPDKVAGYYEDINLRAAEVRLTKNNDDKKPMYKKREGNRRAEIMKVETFNPANKKLQKTFTAKEKIGIRIQYLAHKSLPRPSVGLVFQDQLNTTIFATNNWVMKKPTRALKPGESLLMETVIDNIFTDGKYTISCAIESEDFRIIYDRIEHICSFMVGGQLLAHATTHPTHSVDITYIPATNDKPEITT